MAAPLSPAAACNNLCHASRPLLESRTSCDAWCVSVAASTPASAVSHCDQLAWSLMQADALDLDLSVQDTLERSAGTDVQLSDIKALLGRMMFTGRAVHKKVRLCRCWTVCEMQQLRAGGIAWRQAASKDAGKGHAHARQPAGPEHAQLPPEHPRQGNGRTLVTGLHGQLVSREPSV